MHTLVILEQQAYSNKLAPVHTPNPRDPAKYRIQLWSGDAESPEALAADMRRHVLLTSQEAQHWLCGHGFLQWATPEGPLYSMLEVFDKMALLHVLCTGRPSLIYQRMEDDKYIRHFKEENDQLATALSRAVEILVDNGMEPTLTERWRAVLGKREERASRSFLFELGSFVASRKPKIEVSAPGLLGDLFRLLLGPSEAEIAAEIGEQMVRRDPCASCGCGKLVHEKVERPEGDVPAPGGQLGHPRGKCRRCSRCEKYKAEVRVGSEP